MFMLFDKYVTGKKPLLKKFKKLKIKISGKQK